MFGSEGERLIELRRQKAQQYAEELKQQIASKNSRKPTTPAMYSTTTSDTYSTPPGISPPFSNQPQQYARGNFNQPPSSVSSAPRQFNPPSSANLSLHSPHYLDPLPDFQSTTIAPLNLTISSFQPDPTPSLPRQQTHSSSVDKSSFTERIRSLESVLDQQRTILVQSSESSSRILTSGYPQIEATVNEIQSRIDRIINTELSQLVRPVSDGTLANRESLDSESQNVRNSIDEVMELLNSASTSVPNFTTKFNDTLESIKSGCTEVKTDNGRIIDQTDLSLTKILQVENRESILNDNTSKHTRDFEAIDSNASSSFVNMQHSMNELMTSVSSQIAREIKIESDAREHISTTLQSQVSEVNQKVVDNISRLRSLINNLAENFKDTLTSLNTSISSALEITQNEVDATTTDVDNRLNTFVQNSESNFAAIQTETVSTVTAMKGIITQTRNVLEKAVEDESAIRKKNVKEINSKFDKFESLIAREMGIQLSRVEEVGSQTINKGISTFNAMMQDSKTQMIVVHQYATKIEEAEAKLNNIEKDFTLASTQVREGFKALSANYNEIAKKFEKTKNDIEDSLEEIEKNTEKCKEWVPDSSAKREELIEFEKNINIIMEKKINDIESQISVALKNIVELSVSNRNSDQRRSGSALKTLKKLVDEAECFPADFLDQDDHNGTENSEKKEIKDDFHHDSFSLKDNDESDKEDSKSIENLDNDEMADEEKDDHDDEMADEEKDDHDDEIDFTGNDAKGETA